MIRDQAVRPGRPTPSRRQVLLVVAGSIPVVSVAGCQTRGTQPEGSQAAGHQAGTGRDLQATEAPALAARVKRGALPPLSSRLPRDPLTVKPVERLGTYGGTWRTAIEGSTGTVWLYPTAGYEQLVRWTPTWTGAPGTKEILPNVARAFQVSDDGREYVFQLRPGMRWSDGRPFTADDIVFAQNDVLNDTELYPYQDPSRPHAVKVDDHTVKIRFSRPASLFLRQLCSPAGQELTRHPRHYLQRFHKKYAADIDEVVRREGQDNWVSLFQQKADVWHNAELPTLNPWVVTQPLGKGTRVEVERNPYFWKTDPKGRQLPYIDKIRYPVVSDPEVQLTQALSGDIDMQCVIFNTLPNKPVLARSRAKGGYRFFDAIRSIANNMDICLNLTHEDPVKRKIFQNKDFRIGLSYAVNRQEIIATAFQGQGRPWQQAPPPQSPFYDKEMAQQYVEYDLDKARHHLDRAGYADTGAGGARLGPDGRPIAFRLEVPTNFDPAWIDAAELLARYWRQVGVQVQVRTEDRSLYSERMAANAHDAALVRGNGGLDIFLVPEMYCPTSGYYAPLWAKWYNSGGDEGEAPVAAARKQLELYDQVKAATDDEEQERLMREILRISKEEFWVIGTNLTADYYGIAKDSFRNVPTSMPYSWTYPTPGPTNPEQYFIEA